MQEKERPERLRGNHGNHAESHACRTPQEYMSYLLDELDQRHRESAGLDSDISRGNRELETIQGQYVVSLRYLEALDERARRLSSSMKAALHSLDGSSRSHFANAMSSIQLGRGSLSESWKALEDLKTSLSETQKRILEIERDIMDRYERNRRREQSVVRLKQTLLVVVVALVSVVLAVYLGVRG